MMAIGVPIVAFLAHGFIVHKPYAQMEIATKYIARINIHIISKPEVSCVIKLATIKLIQEKAVTPHRTIKCYDVFHERRARFFPTFHYFCSIVFVGAIKL
jgi:hypothetical protein